MKKHYKMCLLLFMTAIGFVWTAWSQSASGIEDCYEVGL
jgi:hypothetical protein